MGYRINDVHATKLMMKYASTTFVPEKDWSIARYDSKDCLLGGSIVNSYTGVGGSCELHFCSFRPNWGSRTLVYYTFYFPFVELKVRKVIGLVPESNWKSYRLTTHLGFKEEAYISNVFPFEPSGYHILSMYKEDCKWLKMKPVELLIVGE